MRATRVSVGTQHTGTFSGGQMQAQARVATQKVNGHADILAALTNYAYVPLKTDATTASATSSTLLTANITTVLESGFLLVTFTASGGHPTNLGTAYFVVVVDGVVTKGCYTTVPAASAWSAAIMIRVAVTRGAHTVLVKWATDSATLRISAATVATEHAHLLVQEVQ